MTDKRDPLLRAAGLPDDTLRRLRDDFERISATEAMMSWASAACGDASAADVAAQAAIAAAAMVGVIDAAIEREEAETHA